MTARDALEIATRGGAKVLGRDDIGHLSVGMAADLVLWPTGGLAMAGGAVHDPLAALLLCASPSVAWNIVGGRVLVREGELTTVDLGPLVERHDRLAVGLVAGQKIPETR